jgi:hypothetical protein
MLLMLFAPSIICIGHVQVFRRQVGRGVSFFRRRGETKGDKKTRQKKEKCNKALRQKSDK